MLATKPSHIANKFIKSLITSYIPYEGSLTEPKLVVASEQNCVLQQTDEHFPPLETNPVLYTPSGKWAWIANLPFTKTRSVHTLNAGIARSREIKTSTIAGRTITYLSACWLRDGQHDEWQGFFSEIALFKMSNYLKPLQGDVVPELITVHADPLHLSQVYELPHQSFWIEASADMPVVLKERCIEALRKIHARGVLHGDLQLRDLAIGGDGRVTIHRFHKSRALIPQPSVALKEAFPHELEMEMRKLLFMLDYEDAREKETTKMQSALQHKPAEDCETTQEDLEAVRVTEPPSRVDVAEPCINSDDWQKWNRPHLLSRIVVPGQTADEVRATICEFIRKVKVMEIHRSQSGASSSTFPSLPHPCSNSAGTSRKRSLPHSDEIPTSKRLRTSSFTTESCGQDCLGLWHQPDLRQQTSSSISMTQAQSVALTSHRGQNPFLELKERPDLTNEERESLTRHSVIRDANARRFRKLNLPYFDRAGRTGSIKTRGACCALGTVIRLREDARDPYAAAALKEKKKTKYRTLRENNIATEFVMNDGSPRSVPQGPRILMATELEKRWQTTTKRERQSSRLGILRNHDAGPGPVDESALRVLDFDGYGDSPQRPSSAHPVQHPPSNSRHDREGREVWPSATDTREKETLQSYLLEPFKFRPYCQVDQLVSRIKDSSSANLTDISMTSLGGAEDVSKDVNTNSIEQPARITVPQFCAFVPGFSLILGMWNYCRP